MASLTEPDLIAQWWAPGDVQPIVSHTFTLDMGQWGKQSCEVLAVETGRLISYTFGEGVLDTTITWRLVSEGAGTRLFLEQDGFGSRFADWQASLRRHGRGMAERTVQNRWCTFICGHWNLVRASRPSDDHWHAEFRDWDSPESAGTIPVC